MADNGDGSGENPQSDIAELRRQVVTFVSRSFEGAAEKPIDELVSRVLSKRRKKRRKRHNLPTEVRTRPPDPAKREEKEQLMERFYECGEKVLSSRNNGYSLARQLERDKRRLQLQLAERYQQMETGSSEETRELQQPSSSKTSETDDILLKDLQRAITQVDALVRVKKMKLSLTPRLPPLHHRRDSMSDNTITDDQFGLSLLVPPQQVMEQTTPSTSSFSALLRRSGRGGRGGGGVQREKMVHSELAHLLRSPGNGAAAEDSRLKQIVSTSTSNLTTAPLIITDTATKTPISTGGGEGARGGGGGGERISLVPAAELAPITKEMPTAGEGEGEMAVEEPPRIACVMSLVEGQDTASVVEVTADNDEVIETNSSLLSDEKSDNMTVQTPENSLDDRMAANNILPEKEEIVAILPEGYHEEVEVESEPLTMQSQQQPQLTIRVDMNHHSMSERASSSDNIREFNHHDTLREDVAEEELYELIMRDSELAAWIAKARLRPRTPISYRTSRKKRRSRSCSSPPLRE